MTTHSFREILDLRTTRTSTRTPTPKRSDRAEATRPKRRRVRAASDPRPGAEPRDADEPPAPAARNPEVLSNVPDTGVRFVDLGLIEGIQRAIAATGYTHPTPIQAQAIPALLQGRDLLGIAQTGTGKTAAFSLPLLQHLAGAGDKRLRTKRARALILTPTRELAIQIGESIETYGRELRLRHTVIFGGVNQRAQVRTMKTGVDVLVATPGRLLDLMGQGFIALDAVEYFVLDEADRMLDMGFIHDVKRVIAELPKQRQTLLFSATMPSTIVKLSRGLMRDPVRVEVTPASTTVERVEQAVMFVDKSDKKDLLADLFADQDLSRVIVFSRTKHNANRLAQFLDKVGVPAAAIHGNKSQSARQRALGAFTDGDVRALVATDIAARGIDVDEVTHVINFDLPNEPESYVHRIGRTARAGREGVALSFCARDELDYLRDIGRLIGGEVPVLVDQPFHADSIHSAYDRGERGSVKQGGNRGGGGRRRGGDRRQRASGGATMSGGGAGRSRRRGRR
ncbi:MAG: DEAD/DEAH box helicase [Proteobacteria bacterium]|nr:MAG: DEAD/DEAH box helicase [Pseudomonadota bacterium]